MVVLAFLFAKLLYSWVFLTHCNLKKYFGYWLALVVWISSSFYNHWLWRFVLSCWYFGVLPSLLAVETLWQDNLISLFFKLDIAPYIINITMPAYLVNSGLRQEISDSNFDLLWKWIREEDQVSTSVSSSDCETVKKRRNGDWRKQDNGFCNTKPNDTNGKAEAWMDLR